MPEAGLPATLPDVHIGARHGVQFACSRRVRLPSPESQPPRGVQLVLPAAIHRLGGGSNSMMLGDRVYMEYSTTCITSEGSVSQHTAVAHENNAQVPPAHNMPATSRRACLCTSCNASRPSFRAACTVDPSCVPQRGSGHFVVRCQCTLLRRATRTLCAARDRLLTLSFLWSLNPSNTRRRTYLGAQASTHDAVQSQCSTTTPARRCDATPGHALSDVVVGAAATRAEEGAR